MYAKWRTNALAATDFAMNRSGSTLIWGGARAAGAHGSEIAGGA